MSVRTAQSDAAAQAACNRTVLGEPGDGVDSEGDGAGDGASADGTVSKCRPAPQPDALHSAAASLCGFAAAQ